MQLQQRINAFIELGTFLKQFASETSAIEAPINENKVHFEAMQSAIVSAKNTNGWFTDDNLAYAFKSWSEALTQEQLTNWLSPYKISEESTEKAIAIVMAGNIPLVGFHDFLCVLLAGHKAIAKVSSNDAALLPVLSNFLIAQEPAFKGRITITSEKLPDFDAVIATGSDNTAMYFNHYFGKYPSIIRKNRNSVAIIDGTESKAEMEALANDVFRYFGLGCRNVSKLYVPEGYDWDHLFNGMYSWKDVINNHKYMNNYDYNKAVYLMSMIPLLDNEFLLLKEDTAFSSPISVLFYQTYKDATTLEALLAAEKAHIQCIVSKNHVPFGRAQKPNLNDYADGVDTMAFLLDL